MIATASLAPTSAQFEAAVYRKITWRLMPFLFLCYVLAYVDRVNVGFAKLQMQQALGMSDSVYGLGAGIFFIGYFLFEVPANMIMQKIGARRWIGPIMAAWGIVSACTLFVTGAASFYALRFLLGIVESGFFPGVILYTTYWYTQKNRARMVAIFMSAVPISGIFAGPLSGWILERMSGVGHLAAWQWLFLIEGVPSVLAGLVTLYFLTDGPSKAAWLTEEEKRLVLLRLQEEEDRKSKVSQSGRHLGDAFRSAPVWLLSLAYFGVAAGNYGITFWLPQVIKETITQDLSGHWLDIGNSLGRERHQHDCLCPPFGQNGRKTVAYDLGCDSRCGCICRECNSRNLGTGGNCRPDGSGRGFDVPVCRFSGHCPRQFFRGLLLPRELPGSTQLGIWPAM